MSMRLLPLLLLLAAPAAAQGLSGAETAALVSAAMARAGVPGAPPVPVRALPPCSHTPHVEALNGSWSTAELRCDAPAWKRALRTSAPASPAPRAPDAADAAFAGVALIRPLARGSVIAAEDLASGPSPRAGTPI